MSNFANTIDHVRLANGKTHWLRCGLLAFVACISACGKQAASQPADQSASVAAPARPHGPASPAAPAPHSEPSPIAPAHWWNPSWDQRTLSLSNARGYRTFAAAARPSNRWYTLSAAPFVYFMMANSPSLGTEDQASWAWVALFRDCTRGKALIDDLTTEFGDRQRGAATLASVRQEFQAWAATQPPTLTLYTLFKLGPWNSSTGYFAITPGGNAFSTRDAALASETGSAGNFSSGLATVTNGTNSGALRLQHIGQIQPDSAVCPSADGGTFWTSSQTRWDLRFPASDSIWGPALPVLQMTPQDAQAFVGRNPERRVVLEVTVAATAPMAPESGIIHKDGRLVSARFLDADGTVLAERTY